MDIMTTLFNQDYITELYGYEREEKGRNEGVMNTTLRALRNAMTKLKMTLDEAFSFLDIPKEEQDKYREVLSREV